jgi:hypothetical protein
VNPAAPIAAGETAGRVPALETTRRVNGMKATATRPSDGMHAATAETSATVKTATGMHPTAAMETTTATVKASATAVKAATTAVEASTAAAVEAAATATVEAAAATTATGACLCRVCEHEPCDRGREDRGERHR